MHINIVQIRRITQTDECGVVSRERAPLLNPILEAASNPNGLQQQPLEVAAQPVLKYYSNHRSGATLTFNVPVRAVYS